MFWQRRTRETPPTPQERLEERVSAYIDGETDDAERVAIEALLGSDAEARALEADMRMVTTALASLAEVRAPRSFAIVAPPAPAQPRTLMRRLEMATRASAAVAALFFVVAVVNPTGSANDEGATSGASFAQEETQTLSTDAAGSAESLRASGKAAPSEGTSTEPGRANATTEAPDGYAGASAPADASAAGGTAPGGADGGTADSSSDKTDMPMDAFGGGPTPAPAPGTFMPAPASENSGGVALALATLAALLTALSVLMAWDRRKDHVKSR